MAQAWPALGTVLAIDEAYPAGGTYTVIGEITSLTGIAGGEVGERDTTNLASTVKTYMPTIPDNGTVTAEINFDPTDAVHIFLEALKNVPPTGSGQSYLGVNNFKATFATGSSTHTRVWPGFVKSWDGADAEGPDDNLTVSVGIRIAGAVTVV